ncbi:hypothetical protein [Thorsellia anophelis]|uniref:Uncharacterized protein n=1 Tax=Thorsellia anophelis DSM 18579 TaxID=1123402 RepID=A0A1I0DKH0_9GAMM|nr:hypothetical protein [Thorsellia anophelis]SET32955.1 hypothetical protein SAMN02583745_02031 [Thorsellia anophelis DSM 18579]
MGQIKSSKQADKTESLHVKASEPTPVVAFYVYKTKIVAVFLTCIFFLLLSGGMLLLSSGDILAAYQKHRFISSIFLGLILLAIVRGLAWFIQKKKPVLTLSETGIYTDNMLKPLPLSDIEDVQVTSLTSKLVETWTFEFKLSSTVGPIELQGNDLTSSYDKNTHTYRFETIELKGYDKGHVVQLIKHYKNIMNAKSN